ncbi:VOC family protein [Haliangium sp.]|uniref:VOC family protein n=1 Tax=Haliangium sp. TaxID=2663208 RepID=UPI003D0F72AD
MPNAKISQFHLAFPVTDLAIARDFYGRVMGCPEGRSSDVYVDFDFYGHQIVAHIAPALPQPSDSVFDGHEVPVPHFGLNLDRDAWDTLAARLEAHEVRFFEKPHLRLEGRKGEHATMFIFDPFGNALEFKSFTDHDEAFVSDAADTRAGASR